MQIGDFHAGNIKRRMNWTLNTLEANCSKYSMAVNESNKVRVNYGFWWKSTTNWPWFTVRHCAITGTPTIHSLSTLLETNVHLLINAIIRSANLVAAVQSWNHADKSQEFNLILTSNIRMVGKCDLRLWHDCWCQTWWFDYFSNMLRRT